MERFFDIIFSSLALFVFSPIFIIVGIILRFTGEGEIFFMQERIGRSGKIFRLYKFATMFKDSPNIGTGTVTMKNDSRILPIGKYLRKTKINELPQLFNIFVGDMSVIGPRPLTLQTFSAYSIDTQETIKKVRPGLSGVGSIIFRGEEDIMFGISASVDFYKNIIAPYKGSLEEWFVLNKGLYIYFMAIIITIWIVLIPKTRIPWKIFKNLPKPPEQLRKALNYST